jgi:hypothetical protein
MACGAHSVGEGILGFFDTREARALRLECPMQVNELEQLERVRVPIAERPTAFLDQQRHHLVKLALGQQ